MFRKGLFAVVGVMLVSAALAAQSQPVKTVRTDISFDTDVKVGTTVLKAGHYTIVGDATQVTFHRLIDDTGYGSWRQSKDKPVVIPCKSKVLDKKAPNTLTSMPVDASGAHVLKQLVVSGTAVEFDFD